MGDEVRPDRIEPYEDAAGEWRWRRVAPNGDIISDSAEGYTRKGDAIEAGRRANDPTHPVEYGDASG